MQKMWIHFRADCSCGTRDILLPWVPALKLQSRVVRGRSQSWVGKEESPE